MLKNNGQTVEKRDRQTSIVAVGTDLPSPFAAVQAGAQSGRAEPFRPSALAQSVQRTAERALTGSTLVHSFLSVLFVCFAGGHRERIVRKAGACVAGGSC